MGSFRVQRKRDMSEIVESQMVPEVRNLIPSTWKGVIAIQFVVIFVELMYMGIVPGSVGEPEGPMFQSDYARCLRIVCMHSAIG
jgi:hypothetical protein